MKVPEPAGLDAWDAESAARLPQLRQGHLHARASYERIIGVVVTERRNLHPETTKAELGLLATVASLDYELKTLLLRLLEAPRDRAIWQKYLALTLWQVLHELPSQLGSELQAEGKRFKQEIRSVKADRGFMDELARVRNVVAAHLVKPGDGPGRLEWSFEAIVSDVQGHPPALSALAVNATRLSTAVHELGTSLIRRHGAMFPGAKV